MYDEPSCLEQLLYVLFYLFLIVVAILLFPIAIPVGLLILFFKRD